MGDWQQTTQRHGAQVVGGSSKAWFECAGVVVVSRRKGTDLIKKML
jgi:hypothetical protein